MLVITKQQMKIFTQRRLETFKQRMEEYFQGLEYNPRKVSKPDIREFVDAGITSAMQKFTVEAALHKFLLACWLVGPDKVGASDEAMSALKDEDCGELDRADALLNEALESLLKQNQNQTERSK